MAVIRYRDENGNIVPLRVITGEDGQQMFVRFSAYADGKGMSAEWDDTRNYMGIAFAKAAPTSKESYQWICLANLPDGMTLDENGNLHVEGEVTYGRDEFSPREEIASANTRIDGLASGLAISARITSGSYVGTGKGGQSNKNSLTFGFAPKMLFLVGDDTVDARGHTVDGTSLPRSVPSLFWVDGITTVVARTGKEHNPNNISAGLLEFTATRYFSVSNNTIQWHSSRKFADNSFAVDLVAQMNESGKTYKYIAIG